MAPRPRPIHPRTRSDTTLELAELLSHTARRLRRGSSVQLAPLGLTYAQARVLRLVAADGRPLRMADLAAALDVVPRSVTTMVDALEAAGLVARQADPGDRRSVLVALSDEGRRLLDRLDAARRDSAEEVFGGLDGSQRHQLLELLGVLCERGSCVSCCSSTAHHIAALSGPGGVHRVVAPGLHGDMARAGPRGRHRGGTQDGARGGTQDGARGGAQDGTRGGARNGGAR